MNIRVTWWQAVAAMGLVVLSGPAEHLKVLNDQPELLSSLTFWRDTASAGLGALGNGYEPIIGGVAAGILGVPRMTRDVDAVVWLGDRDWSRFLAAGRAFGMIPRIRDALAFARTNRIFLFLISFTM